MSNREIVVANPACIGLVLLWYDVETDDAGQTSARRLVELLARVLGTEPARAAS